MSVIYHKSFIISPYNQTRCHIKVCMDRDVDSVYWYDINISIKYSFDK